MTELFDWLDSLPLFWIATSSTSSLIILAALFVGKRSDGAE